MKSKKFLICSFILICLTVVENCYACGHCNTAFYWHKSPVYIGIFLTSFCYGITIYFIYAVQRLIQFKKYIRSFLIFLLISYIFYFSATEGMVGAPAFIAGSVFCFLMPLYFYFKPTIKTEANKDAVVKAKRISLILLPVFIALSLAIGSVWQVKADKYFDEHLIEMLKIPSISVGYSVMSKLVAIEDKTEQGKYIKEIKKIIIGESYHGISRSIAVEILAKWEDKGAVPTILQAWEKGTLPEYEANPVLRRLSGEDFSTLKDWQNWWQNQED